jgi:hypothetical protein
MGHLIQEAKKEMESNSTKAVGAQNAWATNVCAQCYFRYLALRRRPEPPVHSRCMRKSLLRSLAILGN